MGQGLPLEIPGRYSGRIGMMHREETIYLEREDSSRIQKALKTPSAQELDYLE